MLVESVTGTVPAIVRHRHRHAGRAHAHARCVAPLELGRLGPVIERAGRPDPAERYPDAATMRAALADAARAFPPPQPLVARRARAARRRRRRAHADRRSLDPVVRPGRAARADGATSRGPSPLHEAPTGAAVAASRAVWSSVSRSSLALVGGGLAFAAVAAGGGTVAVPSVVGLSLRRRRRSGSRPTGSRCTIVERNADDPKGVVIAQQPAPGGSFAERRRPSASSSCRAGRRRCRSRMCGRCRPTTRRPRLEEAGFVVTVERPNNETVPYDDVIDTDPAGRREAPRDSEITLLVSNGPAPVQVPDVTEHDATTKPRKRSPPRASRCTRSDDFSDTVPATR